MKESTQEVEFKKDTESWSIIKQIAGEGRKENAATALENEMQEYIDNYQTLTDEKGKQMVVRNGYLPERDILTGVGSLNLKKPRVRKDTKNESTGSRECL